MQQNSGSLGVIVLVVILALAFVWLWGFSEDAPSEIQTIHELVNELLLSIAAGVRDLVVGIVEVVLEKVKGVKIPAP